MKKCKQCGETLPETNYYTRWDGHLSLICKKCQIKNVNSNPRKSERKNNPDPEAENRNRESDKRYQRRKRLNNPGMKAEESRKYRQNYPEKARVTGIVYMAIKSGKIKKSNCEVCGREDSQAHHEDYTKPLAIHWLCPVHHKLRHEEIKKIT